MIRVSFSPKLDKNDIKSEAVRIYEEKENMECKNAEFVIAQQTKETVSLLLWPCFKTPLLLLSRAQKRLWEQVVSIYLLLLIIITVSSLSLFFSRYNKGSAIKSSEA